MDYDCNEIRSWCEFCDLCNFHSMSFLNIDDPLKHKSIKSMTCLQLNWTCLNIVILKVSIKNCTLFYSKEGTVLHYVSTYIGEVFAFIPFAKSLVILNRPDE